MELFAKPTPDITAATGTATAITAPARAKRPSRRDSWRVSLMQLLFLEEHCLISEEPAPRRTLRYASRKAATSAESGLSRAARWTAARRAGPSLAVARSYQSSQFSG